MDLVKLLSRQILEELPVKPVDRVTHDGNRPTPQQNNASIHSQAPKQKLLDQFNVHRFVS
jgi:hypothetical protein